MLNINKRKWVITYDSSTHCLQIPSLFFSFLLTKRALSTILWFNSYFAQISFLLLCSYKKGIHRIIFCNHSRFVCRMLLHKTAQIVKQQTNLYMLYTYIERFLFTVFLVIGFIIASTKNISNINYYSLSHTILLLCLYAHFCNATYEKCVV